jgi:hypothetical protein
MPDWGWSLGGGNSSATSGGIDLSSLLGIGAQAQGMASPEPGVGSSPAPVPRPASGQPHPQQQAGLSLQPQPTGNPGNDRGKYPGPPGSRDFWSGTANHWVDPTYQTDATGQVLTPEEQAAWRDYDRRRAEAASARASNSHGSPATPTSTTAGIEYNPKTGKWDWLDPKTKQWGEAASFDEIWAKLTPDEQALHPRFWYDNMAQTQDSYENSARLNRYRQTQSNDLQGTPTIRSAPVRF